MDVSTLLLFNEVCSSANARVARLAVGRQPAHNLHKNLAKNFLAGDAGDLFLGAGLARMKTPVDLVLDSEKPLLGAKGVLQGWNIELIPFKSLPQPFLVRHAGLGFLQGDCRVLLVLHLNGSTFVLYCRISNQVLDYSFAAKNLCLN